MPWQGRRPLTRPEPGTFCVVPPLSGSPLRTRKREGMHGGRDARGATIMHKQTKFPPPPIFPPPASLDVLFQTNVVHSFQHLRLIQISFPLRGRCHLLPTLSHFHSHPFNKAGCCSVHLPPPPPHKYIPIATPVASH